MEGLVERLQGFQGMEIAISQCSLEELAKGVQQGRQALLDTAVAQAGWVWKQQLEELRGEVKGMVRGLEGSAEVLRRQGMEVLGTAV